MTAQLWDKVANQVNFNLEIDVQRFCHLVKPDARIQNTRLWMRLWPDSQAAETVRLS